MAVSNDSPDGFGNDHCRLLFFPLGQYFDCSDLVSSRLQQYFVFPPDLQVVKAYGFLLISNASHDQTITKESLPVSHPENAIFICKHPDIISL